MKEFLTSYGTWIFITVFTKAFSGPCHEPDESSPHTHTHTTSLGQLVACHTPRRPVFDPSSVDVRFVVDEVALWKVFLSVLGFCPVSTIPPMLHTHRHLNITFIRRASGRSLGTLKQALFFWKSGRTGCTSIVTFWSDCQRRWTQQTWHVGSGRLHRWLLVFSVSVNVARVHPVGAAAASLYFSLSQIDGHEGAATVAASCLRSGFLSQPACLPATLLA
jgi:hypothetical protein